MAEHLNQAVEPELNAFSAMGKPLSTAARQKGFEACKDMGLNSARAWECVNGVVEQLERDKPYEAQAAAMKFIDLTGAYRLMATLLAAAR